LAAIPFRPRPQQQELLEHYLAHRGKMGIAAVPGSGKTTALSYLAAQLVAHGLEDDQEVLIVTLVNSAVDNFARRIAGFIQEARLLPGYGYRVRTLHGLAHDIVRMRPALAGLADDFRIINERESLQLLEEVAGRWLRANPLLAEEFLSDEMEANTRSWAANSLWPELIKDIAARFIKQAKDLRLAPFELEERLAETHFLQENGLMKLARMGLEIYRDYQLGLTYRGAVDFDDLIRLALEVIERDEAFLERLRRQWPYILEDEAQDSSYLQEEILRRLAGPDGNWVRVGDPNQSVYHTFTNADPRYLINFLDEPGVARRELTNSGRSTESIIGLANYLIDWTQNEHPTPAVRDSLRLPHIEPTPPDDPQPNPSDDPGQVHLRAERYTPEEEVKAIAKSAGHWLAEHPQGTVAILVPTNNKGVSVAAALKQQGVEYVELLNSTAPTREAASILEQALRHLADPTSARQLSRLFRAWRYAGRLSASGETEEADDEERRLRQQLEKALRHCERVEDYLWPRGERDWLEEAGFAGGEMAGELLSYFRELVQRWQAAAGLPIDQLILTLAQDLFTRPADLALAHKLALELRRRTEANPTWRLAELAEELAVIVRNERRFLGFADEDFGFEPPQGKVTVATMHRAKGLEWERVYLLSVNNYDFPSGQPHDTYLPERWFLRDGLNLEAEAMAQLEVLERGEPESYWEGAAGEEARLKYIAERLRLLYVGITRARKELVITWNSGKGGTHIPPLQPAAPFLALQTWWEEKREAPYGNLL
jgi:DNA helicase-2/ATP-dependent DNA helicase PcrA